MRYLVSSQLASVVYHFSMLGIVSFWLLKSLGLDLEVSSFNYMAMRG